MNGQLVTLHGFNAERGRWEAELANGEKVNVLPIHLTPPTVEEEGDIAKRRRIASAVESESASQSLAQDLALPWSPVPPPAGTTASVCRT